MTITRERLEQYAYDKHMCNINDEIRELARIALASLEAEPVGITDNSEIECLKRGEMANAMPPYYKGVDSGDEVYLYTAPPAPVVPEAISTREAISKMEECEPCDSINVAYKYGWNACRAAMLKGGKS